jgi:hypothetical protein
LEEEEEEEERRQLRRKREGEGLHEQGAFTSLKYVLGNTCSLDFLHFFLILKNGP